MGFQYGFNNLKIRSARINKSQSVGSFSRPVSTTKRTSKLSQRDIKFLQSIGFRVRTL